jgi:hypothetical protein
MDKVQKYNSFNIKEYEMGEACSMHKRDENEYKILVGKPEVKRPPGRPTDRGKNYVEMYLT